MLKIFYKTLLVSLLSGSLLLLNFSQGGFMIQVNSLQAETLKTDAVKDSPNMMATLTMTAVGLLASRLYKAKMTTDIMLAAAGGALFIAGDIVAVFKNKEVLKDLETEITRDEAGKIEQKQIETIEKLKQSYVAAKGTATIKKNLQMAAAAAFAAAGVSAYMMAASEQALAAACMLGIKGGLAAAAQVLAVCKGHSAKAAAAYARPKCSGCPEGARETAEAAACNKELAACTTKIGFDMTLLMSYQSARETPSSSASGLTADTAQASTIISTVPMSAGTCSNYAKPMAAIELAGQCPTMATVGNAQNSGTAPLTIVQNDIKNILYPNERHQSEDSKNHMTSHYIEKILNMAFPKAHADVLGLMGIAFNTAVKFVLETSTHLASELDLNLLIPKRRAITWGVLAGASLAASTATGSELGKIQTNIDKIDAILNSMYALKDGVLADNTTSVKDPKNDKDIINNPKAPVLNPVRNQEIDLKSQGGTEGLPCMTGDNPNDCPSFSKQLSAQPDVVAMPEFIQAQIANIATLTDGINGKSKISAATQDLVQSIAGQQNALKNELLKQQKALQSKLKESGSKTDLAQESAKLEAAMKAAVQKELDKRKTTAAAMLASFSPAGNSATDANQNISKDNKAKKFINGSGGTSLASAIVPTAKIDKSDLNDDLKTQEGEETKITDAVATATVMDDYDVKNDITHDKDSSIFDLISNRYQRSYERLFKRVK